MTTLAAAPPAAVPGAESAPEGLRDIVGPVPIPNLWLWLAVAAAVLLAALLFAWWWRRRRRQAPAIPDTPPVPPEVRARQALEALLRDLADPDRFCTGVSRVLRVYLEERFGWNAPDRTTEEFLQQLRERPEFDPGHRLILEDFLMRCDRVKFARHDPTESELLDLHRAATGLVEDTTPAPLASTAPARTGAPVA